MNKNEFRVHPIGYIRAKEGSFYIETDKKYIKALNGLNGYSHLNVLCWFHHVDNTEYRKIVEADKPYKNAPDKIGIFATRSPVRPNPIALTAVAALKIDEETGIIHIPYIDAEDGTPVLDIKPYHPSVDRIKEVSVPEWCSHWPKWYEDSATFDWEAEFENAC